MGEIAEMMLDGTLCEGCGEYIHQGEAQGYPRYCSRQCAQDRGAVAAKDPSTLFYLKDEAALAALERWLEPIHYTKYKAGLFDKKQQPMIGLKHGGEKCGIVVCANDRLAKQAETLIHNMRAL